MGRQDADVSGLLLLDKPAGITSHDAVARARRWLRTRRIGHAGTLDPMATGLLTLCVGNATRLVEYLTGQDKHYVAAIRLGETTNTDDAEGEVLERLPVAPIDALQLERLRLRFTGDLMQTPPQFSAIKIDGVRSYARARQGETVDLDARPVKIHALELLADENDATMLHARVHCGSGTYIRALARDIGRVLGCGAHLIELRRTMVGALSVADALSADQAEDLASRGDLARRLLPADRVLADAPAIQLDAAGARAICRGQFVRVDPGANAIVCRVYGPGSRFIAVGAATAGVLRPLKVLVAEHDASGALVS